MKPKQVILIRRDLKMRRGKEIAQGAHASMAAILNLVSKNQNQLIIPLDNKAVSEWLNGSFTKVCLQVHSEEELKEYYDKALKANIPCSLIQDSGLTEFNNIPTYTCVAIGPAQPDIINSITGQLTLY